MLMPVYEIRIQSHLEDRMLEWFEGLTITSLENGESILSGPIVDQSALHGFLAKIRQLDLVLISVKKIDPG